MIANIALKWLFCFLSGLASLVQFFKVKIRGNQVSNSFEMLQLIASSFSFCRLTICPNTSAKDFTPRNAHPYNEDILLSIPVSSIYTRSSGAILATNSLYSALFFSHLCLYLHSFFYRSTPFVSDYYKNML